MKMTTETVYTNSFSALTVDWSETGVTPYLHDTDADFIGTSVDAKVESNWAFPTSVGLGTINSVKFGLELLGVGAGTGAIKLEVWANGIWNDVGNVASTNVMEWVETDVSTLLTTWAKINGCHVRLTSVITGAMLLYARRLTRIIAYTNIAQQILDENRWTIADITIANVQYLIDNASHYINLMAGTTIPNLVGDVLVASDNELTVVKMLTALLIRAYLDRGPNVSLGSISITSVLTDPQYNLFTDMVTKAIEQLKLDASGTAGIAFAVGTDDADLV
jgi:hypothetical protein